MLGVGMAGAVLSSETLSASGGLSCGGSAPKHLGLGVTNSF